MYAISYRCRKLPGLIGFNISDWRGLMMEGADSTEHLISLISGLLVPITPNEDMAVILCWRINVILIIEREMLIQ